MDRRDQYRFAAAVLRMLAEIVPLMQSDADTQLESRSLAFEFDTKVKIDEHLDSVRG